MDSAAAAFALDPPAPGPGPPPAPGDCAQARKNFSVSHLLDLEEVAAAGRRAAGPVAGPEAREGATREPSGGSSGSEAAPQDGECAAWEPAEGLRTWAAGLGATGIPSLRNSGGGAHQLRDPRAAELGGGRRDSLTLGFSLWAPRLRNIRLVRLWGPRILGPHPQPQLQDRSYRDPWLTGSVNCGTPIVERGVWDTRFALLWLWAPAPGTRYLRDPSFWLVHNGSYGPRRYCPVVSCCCLKSSSFGGDLL